jgi:hypothetical protein
VEANALDREADAKRELYKQLSTEAQTSLQSAQNSMSSATIVDHAIPPQDPASPNRPLFLVLAAMLGIMAGAATIAVQEMLSGSVRSTDDIEKLGLRLLTAVPAVSDPRLASLIVGKPTSIYADPSVSPAPACSARAGGPKIPRSSPSPRRSPPKARPPRRWPLPVRWPIPAAAR